MCLSDLTSCGPFDCISDIPNFPTHLIQMTGSLSGLVTSWLMGAQHFHLSGIGISKFPISINVVSVSPHAPVGNVELLPTGSTGSKKSNRSTLNLIWCLSNHIFLKGLPFSKCFLRIRIREMNPTDWETFHLACQVKAATPATTSDAKYLLSIKCCHLNSLLSLRRFIFVWSIKWLCFLLCCFLSSVPHKLNINITLNTWTPWNRHRDSIAFNSFLFYLEDNIYFLFDPVFVFSLQFLG